MGSYEPAAESLSCPLPSASPSWWRSGNWSPSSEQKKIDFFIVPSESLVWDKDFFFFFFS